MLYCPRLASALPSAPLAPPCSRVGQNGDSTARVRAVVEGRIRRGKDAMTKLGRVVLANFLTVAVLVGAPEVGRGAGMSGPDREALQGGEGQRHHDVPPHAPVLLQDAGEGHTLLLRRTLPD